MTARLPLPVAILFLALSTTAQGESGAGRDPFTFGVTRHVVAMKRSAPKVEMILIHGDKRYAIIDGQKKLVGDALAGGVITAITLNSVMVDKSGESIEYKIEGAP